ncbi:hypothetical protein DFH09DRAFT_1079470 [Mycena vulgaris]|nr:hypothetical protein DFH09DRAFT_1079470 [Mycena vulgaris]
MYTSREAQLRVFAFIATWATLSNAFDVRAVIAGTEIARSDTGPTQFDSDTFPDNAQPSSNYTPVNDMRELEAFRAVPGGKSLHSTAGQPQPRRGSASHRPGRFGKLRVLPRGYLALRSRDTIARRFPPSTGPTTVLPIHGALKQPQFHQSQRFRSEFPHN